MTDKTELTTNTNTDTNVNATPETTQSAPSSAQGTRRSDPPQTGDELDRDFQGLWGHGLTLEYFEHNIVKGMPVYAAHAEKIGAVQQVDLTNGWLQTEKGVLFAHDRWIPFSAIERLGPSGIYLSMTKDYIKETYGQPPFIYIDVVAVPTGATISGTITSGYDGSRIAVDSTTIIKAIKRLGRDPKVYDADGATVGRVTRYDLASCWIVVEARTFSPQDLYIPITAVAYLAHDSVHLRVTKDVLHEAFKVPPATATFVATSD
jgi:hypothetical protein